MRWCWAFLWLFLGVDVYAAEWTKLSSLPDREGFASCFAGVSHGVLLAAGGANFPDKKPWEGGKKVWYADVFALDKPNGEWRKSGALPRPLAYGVSASIDECVVCVGGSDAERHYAEAFRLEWKSGSLLVSSLPSLPVPLANGCGVNVGPTLYVVGGQERPDGPALATTWKLELAQPEPKWKRLADCLGEPRILATAARIGERLYIAGGATLVAGAEGKFERRYLRDLHRLEADGTWTRLADLPRAATAAPSPGPSDASSFWILGGDDGTQLTAGPLQHRGFSQQVLRFDERKNAWAEDGEIPAPRVTAPCVEWNGRAITISGEQRPGVRSPEVWSWQPGETR